MGIDLPRDLGTPRLPFSRLARIVQHLPIDSALARARRDQRPTIDTQLLRRIEFWTHLAYWGQTKDGEKGRNTPAMIPLHGDHDRRRGLELDEKLARLDERRRARQAQLEGRPAAGRRR